MSYLDRVFENSSEEITVPNVVNFQNGIKVNGTALSTSEMTALDGVTAGTVTASKAVIAGSNKNIDTIVIADGGLKLGSGSGTAVTAKAAELNLVDDLPATCTFTPAAGGLNVCEVTIQAKDALGVNMTRACMLLVYLSDSSSGIGLTATSASGTVQAKAASGTDFGVLTAKKALLVQTLADGSYVLEITDSAKTGFYVCAVPLRGGAPSVSAQLVSGNYGS